MCIAYDVYLQYLYADCTRTRQDAKMKIETTYHISDIYLHTRRFFKKLHVRHSITKVRLD